MNFDRSRNSNPNQEKTYYTFLAKDMFSRDIPFKIYSITNHRGNSAEHTHDYMQIWYVMHGCCSHFVNGKSHTLTKGNIFVLPPFVSHEVRVEKGDSVRIIGCEFSAEFINDNIPTDNCTSSLFDFAYLEPFLVSTDAVRPRLQLTGLTQEKVENLMMDMLNEYQNEEKYYEINIKADLLKLLAIIAREYEKQDINDDNHELFERYRDAINSAIQFIHENYTRQIYIDEVCKIAMMSQPYFSHLFKQMTGKTFVEYVNNLRIRNACDLLLESSMTISEICFTVGFNDTTYFNKVFKKETGLAPSIYRNLSISKGRKI
jgi:AraC-like DNA-binding protein/mannose-6-phosphate isomerase-like protein (cupin superfamily)